MPANKSPQPTILVKKSDGTSVRMTLAEIRAAKSGSTKVAPDKSVSTTVAPDKSAPVKVAPVISGNKVPLKKQEDKKIIKQKKEKKKKIEPNDKITFPAVETPHELATTAPVSNIFIDEAQAKGSIAPEPKVIKKKKRRRRNKKNIVVETPVPVTPKPLPSPVSAPLEEEMPYIDADMFPGAVDVDDDIIFTLDPTPEQQLPAVETPHELATTAPVPHIFVDEAKANMGVNVSVDELHIQLPEKKEKIAKQDWDTDDHTSLLDEEVPDITETYVDVSDLVSVRRDMILKKIASLIPKELQGRLAALILSYVKGVRTRRDILAYLLQSVEKGGIGINTDTAASVLEIMEKGMQEDIAPMPPVVSPIVEKRLDKTPVQTVSTVVEKIPVRKTEQHTIPVSTKVAPGKPVSTKVAPGKPVSTSKPLMQDVIAPRREKRTVGPVDEMKQYTLVEFRRVSERIDARISRIIEKFNLLQKEDYILYLEAQEAWSKSPLYRMYQDIIARAFQERKTVEEILTKEQIMTIEEFYAMIKINSEVLT